MKKYAIILTAALFVCAFSGCDEETTLPYIPVEKPDNNTPPEGDDPDTYTVTTGSTRCCCARPRIRTAPTSTANWTISLRCA